MLIFSGKVSKHWHWSWQDYVHQRSYSSARPHRRRRWYRLSCPQRNRDSSSQTTIRAELPPCQCHDRRGRQARTCWLLTARRPWILGRPRGQMGQDCFVAVQRRQASIILLLLPSVRGRLLYPNLGKWWQAGGGITCAISESRYTSAVTSEDWKRDPAVAAMGAVSI